MPRLVVVPRAQTRSHSFVEASANVVLGIGINIVIIQGLFHISLVENLAVTGLMTAISFARQYSIRRLFNLLH